MLHKRNTEYLKGIRKGTHNDLGTDISSLFKKKCQVFRNWNLSFFKALAPVPDRILPYLFLGKDTDTERGSVCSLIRTSGKALNISASYQWKEDRIVSSGWKTGLFPLARSESVLEFWKIEHLPQTEMKCPASCSCWHHISVSSESSHKWHLQVCPGFQ